MADLWVTLLVYTAALVVLAGVIYFAVRAAALWALKEHTKWVDGGKHEPRQRLPYS